METGQQVDQRASEQRRLEDRHQPELRREVRLPADVDRPLV